MEAAALLLAAGASVLQQLLQHAALSQRPQVAEVLGDDRDALAAGRLVAVRQRTEEGVVLVRGEVVPAARVMSDVTCSMSVRRDSVPV